MLVYRDPARDVSGPVAKDALLCAVRRLVRDPIGDCAIEALLRAGELECALADQGHQQSERTAAYITDAIASHVLVDNGPALSVVERSLHALDLPQELHFKTPDGYAYYGLDPRQYAAVANSVETSEHGAPVAVIGIRSIGTSLGAIVSETLRLRGRVAERITVRPLGQPWAHVVRFDRNQAAFIEQMRNQRAQFLVVDEGPYAHGSTFLAVAEGLERASVPRNSIALCTSRTRDPAPLRAKATAARWARYRCYAAAPWTPVSGADVLSYGAWRNTAYGMDTSAWPACWVQLERIKRRDAGGHWLDKFEGLPPYSDAPFERACAAAKAGYAPAPLWLGHGFVRYPWLPGRPARARDLDERALCEMARYCAFRTRAFPAQQVDADALQHMARTNLDEAFGIDLGDRVRFEVEVPVIPDARMQPFEWIVSPNGKWLKTDGHAHGDGPLLPGPSDIAWDLAGAIIEWNMNHAQRERFLADYARLTGDRPHARLPAYLIGYCAERLGETHIAACAATPAERARLHRARDSYRARLERWLAVMPRHRAARLPGEKRQRRLSRERSAHSSSLA